MYYEDLIDNKFDDEASAELRLKQKETISALRNIDKNYEKYKIPFNNVWTDGKYHKSITIENYGSESTGTLIRNAVTGIRYDIKVGSEYENILFKVTDSTGYNKRKEPLILYYDSPEQYEKHRFTNVSDVIKKKWLKNHYLFKKKLNM
jgi:hypothetical protein